MLLAISLSTVSVAPAAGDLFIGPSYLSERTIASGTRNQMSIEIEIIAGKPVVILRTLAGLGARVYCQLPTSIANLFIWTLQLAT